MKTFKGLFIDNGVIKAGEFPVEPESFIPETEEEYNMALHDAQNELPQYIHREYRSALTSAKANAVECEDQTLAATLMNGVKEGDVFVLPSGWDYRVVKRCTNCERLGCESISCRDPYDRSMRYTQVAILYRTDGQIKLDRLGNTSSPVIQTEESQEDMWTDVLHITKSYDTDSFYNTVRTLMKHFTITRKP